MSENCPFCREPISETDSTCPHCGSLLDSRQSMSMGLKSGTVLSDRYQIVREVGQGGMSTVYMAEETFMATGRMVAIKVLPPQMTMDPSILSRFQDEIRTAARLDHPGIVPIYFVGEHEGLYYFVMKFLSGGTISQLVRKNGPFSEDDTRKIMAQVADALAYAHGQGVVHRDIKAGNIMISAEGMPTLMDFGVARSAESNELTLPGQVIGTVEYMAPEQWQGEVDPRSDLYALGIVMFYMMAGALPFKSKNAFELMKMHQESTPPPIKALVPDISLEMIDIINWCMKKDRESRVPSAKHLAALLRGEEKPPETESNFDASEYENRIGDAPEKDLEFPTTITSTWKDRKVTDLIEEAEKQYNAGNLVKALKIAKKIQKLNPQSSTIEFQIKKYESFKKAIDNITEQAQKKIKDGFIRQAIKDYEKIQVVYDTPAIQRPLDNAKKEAVRLKQEFLKGKRLYEKRKFRRAIKIFEEVSAKNAELGEAILYKQKAKEALAKQPSFLWKLKTPTIVLLILGGLVYLGMNAKKIVYFAAKQTRAREMYTTPPVLNLRNIYSLLDFMEGDRESRESREQDLREISLGMIETGNEFYKKDKLPEALFYYSQAYDLLPNSSIDKESIGGMIDMIRTQMTVVVPDK